MRTVPASRGPFAQRPHYKITEIERICIEALKSTGLLPDAPKAIRIERFVEKFFDISPSYESLPDGVLGYTKFGHDGVKAIVVTTALDEEGGQTSDRRIRTTLAHEAGHGLLHMHLFAVGENPRSLFGHDHDRPEILCRDVQSVQQSRAYDGRWWEFQANQAIGSLLMPRRLVLQAAEPFCEPCGQMGLAVLRADLRERAVAELAEVFDVNPAVVRIRLQGIFPNGDMGQLSL